MLPLSFCGAAMSEQRPSKRLSTQLLEWAGHIHSSRSGEKALLQQAARKLEEAENLQLQKANLMSALESKQARIDALMLEFCPGEMSAEQRAEWAEHQQPSHEPESAPVAWQYRVNGVHVFYTECEPPPDDAYDEGTLQPLYARPAQPPGDGA
jgi:hypothetical protein